MEEVFKQVNGYEGKYEISNHGRLASINGRKKGRVILTGGLDLAGYVSVTLRKPGKRFCTRMHVLVAEHFIEKRLGATCVNHIDGDKSNNMLTNLEWVTYLENSQHAVRTGLLNIVGENHALSKVTNKQVLEIRKLYHTMNHKQIAEIYGLCRRQVGDIINGVNWGHLPLEDYSGRCIKRVRVRPSITADILEKAHKLRQSGLSIRKIAPLLEVKYGALYSIYIKEFGNVRG